MWWATTTSAVALCSRPSRRTILACSRARKSALITAAVYIGGVAARPPSTGATRLLLLAERTATTSAKSKTIAAAAAAPTVDDSCLEETTSSSTASSPPPATPMVAPMVAPLDALQMATAAAATMASATPRVPLSAAAAMRVDEPPHAELTFSREWKRMDPEGLLGAYLQLSKHRLTALITATAISGYFMSPAVFSPQVLASLTIGTALMSASANACNHLLEAPYDAQMRRTQKRVLVVHRFSPLHAFLFANTTAAVGLGFLCVGCNSLTAALGLANILLYAGVYTPMKRYHIGCTWAGAVVGAIPPLMGYTALTGRLDAAAFVLAAILYSWQFPHFNALSWRLRGDYSRAGYWVMCVTNQALCRKTTLRHSIALLVLCSALAPLSNLTTYTFALDSIPLNALMCYLAYKFYRAPDEESAKTLFHYTLLYLPLVMMLMVVSNTGRAPDEKRRLDGEEREGGLNERLVALWRGVSSTPAIVENT